MSESFKWMHITPNKAAEMLRHNRENRPMSQVTVDLYASQMLCGRWRLCDNDPICLTAGDDYVLLNGQHRLQAVVKSGVGCDFWVNTNAKKENFDVMDIGHNRRVHAILQIKGYKNTNRMASIVGATLKLRNGGMIFAGCGKNKSPNIGGGKRLMPQDIEEEYLKHRDMYDLCIRQAGLCYKSGRICTTRALGGYMAFLIIDGEHAPHDVFNFFDLLTDTSKPAPVCISCIRKTLFNNLGSSKKIEDSFKQRMIIKAWNYYITEKENKIVRVTDRDEDISFVHANYNKYEN